MNQEQLEKVRSGKGFIAALDQSGGSTPKALKLYGVEEDQYSGDAEMYDQIHQMRSRIVESPSFNGERVLGAILFEMTMDRQIDGIDTGEYLWSRKQVVPFLKVDKGLADEVDGAQVMKPMPELDALLARGAAKGMFGTKMRSVIKLANAAGVNAVVDQQFEVGRQILAAGLVPIIEPEVDINSPEKAEAETLLKAAILAQLDQQSADQPVMLKLTLPETDGFYQELVDHPAVLRVVALSGGYSRDDANARLARNPGVIASFSRALTEGPLGPAERGRVRHHPRRRHPVHLRGIQHLTGTPAGRAQRTTTVPGLQWGRAPSRFGSAASELPAGGYQAVARASVGRSAQRRPHGGHRATRPGPRTARAPPGSAAPASREHQSIQDRVAGSRRVAHLAEAHRHHREPPQRDGEAAPEQCEHGPLDGPGWRKARRRGARCQQAPRGRGRRPRTGATG